MQSASKFEFQHLEYWQDRLFVTVVLYSLPAGFCALVPSVWLEYRSGHLLLCYFDIASLIIFGIVSLCRGFSLKARKVAVAVIFATIAIIFMAVLGSFSMGCIYLFTLSVFVSLQFSDKAAYGTVAFNSVAFLTFAADIQFHAVDLPLLYQTSVNIWLVYTMNFLLMNLVVVGLVRQLLKSLNQTMVKEAWLTKELKKGLEQQARLNTHLKNSEEHYRTLFYHSPSPKLIFETDNLQFLQVNKAAVTVYGYSEGEFLNMKLTDIHPEECIQNMLHHVKPADESQVLHPYVTQHVSKDGKRIHTEIRRSNISINGKNARLMVATDITERLLHTAAIEKQNEKLREIAHLQSHVIRLPLARIMSISELIKQEYGEQIDLQLINYLDISVNELDSVIQQIVTESTVITTEQQEGVY
ncbi:PAS domain S-box protein [Mucilaginibacter lacusdianchii]|uniref:PAS domain S-box protein n=1 Tax=Mucilaginibacter lacusdianchii TaxID=2684211 RepID=UPI00131EBD89|nr:PAS domain S-box protein [Mucilaginibacter sp. JXJ CY 39]